jgi:hypothetical protein
MATYPLIEVVDDVVIPLITANDDQFPAVWHIGPFDADGGPGTIDGETCTHWFTDTFTGAAADLSTHTPEVIPAGGVWESGFFALDGAGRAIPDNIAVGGGNATSVFAPNTVIGTDYIIKAVLTRAGSADQAIAVRITGNALSYVDIGLTLSGTNALAVLFNNQAGGLSFLILPGLAANPNPRKVVLKIIGGLAYQIYLDDSLVGSGSSATPYMSEFNKVTIRNEYNAGPAAEDVAVNDIDISNCPYP